MHDDDDGSSDDVTEIMPKAKPPNSPHTHTSPEDHTIALSEKPVGEAEEAQTATLSPTAQARLITAPALPFKRAPRRAPEDLIEENVTKALDDVTAPISPDAQSHLQRVPALPFRAGPTPTFPSVVPAKPSADSHDSEESTRVLSSAEQVEAEHADVLPFAPTLLVSTIAHPHANVSAAPPEIKTSTLFHRVAPSATPASTSTPEPIVSPPDPPRQTGTIPLIHDSNVSVISFPWMFQGHRHLRTVVVKLTTDIVPGDVARIRQQPDLVHGDVFVGDDRRKSLMYASDFAPQKVSVDVTLVGHAIAPAGSIESGAIESAVVAFRFGDPSHRGFHRKIAVFGPRRFERFADGTVSPGKPERWSRVPLGYELAFGGVGSPDNPVGIGKDGTIAPQLEHPTRLIRNPDSTIPAACFAAISPYWPVRASKIGTFDAQWNKQRWPSLPANHDWTYWQCAPTEQQIENVRGDETFVLSGMHPEHAEIEGRLPGKKYRCFAAKNGQLHEIPLRLDAIAFNADELVVHLVFRGSLESADEEATEVAALFITDEPCAGPSLSMDEVRARYHAKRPTPIATPAEPLTKPANDAAHDTFAPQHAILRADLAAAGVASLGPLSAVTAAEKPPADQPAPSSPDSPGRRRVEELLAIRAPLANLDLADADLSGLDLSGQSLVKTNLRRANLTGANLEEADLTDVRASEALLAGVKAARVTLNRADLTKANLQGANLEGASLNAAIFTDAFAEEANFRKTHGERTQFVRAVLDKAVFDQADLSKADFSSATLHDVTFVEARLPDVRLYDVRGNGVHFDEATLTGARADAAQLERGSFCGVEASGSVWDDAKLSEANFSWAALSAASFQRATLQRADFSGAKLMNALFRKARLVEASFVKANLMHASLESADLTGAVLREANLYGAETWRAKIERTDLDRALVQKTKLEDDKK